MKKGDVVKVCVDIRGFKSYEKTKIVRITKKYIYLEDSDQPFNADTGNLDYLNGLGLGRQYITGIKKPS